MKNKKTKLKVPWKKINSEPNFIRFSKIQQSYLTEVMKRQLREFNEAIGSIYEELGIVEKLLNTPPGTYKLRQDCSGLDVSPVLKEKKEKDD